MTEKKIIQIPSMKRINALPKKYKGISSFSGCGGSSTGVKMAGIQVLIATEFIKPAIETYEKNHKGTRVIGEDIRNVDWDAERTRLGLKVGELDFSEGSPPCFPPGELVFTTRGHIPIEQVIVGDKVLTHEQRLRPVTELLPSMYKGKLYDILSYAGAMRVTAEHPVYARLNTGGKIKRSLGEPEWVNASDLTEDHYLALPTHFAEQEYKWKGVSKFFYHCGTGEYMAFGHVNTLPVHMEDFWWIVGRWLGDGWVRYHENESGIGSKRKKPRQGCIICCDKTDGGVELSEILQRVKSCGLNYRVSERRTCYRISLKGKEICHFFLQFKHGAHNKFIPGRIMAVPRPKLKELVKGYLSADGTKLGVGHHRYSTVSKQLAYGMSSIINRVTGTPVHIRKRKQHHTASVIEGRDVVCKDIYVCEFRTRSAKNKRFWVKDEDDLIWVPINSITVEKYKGPVFNFSVAEDETYTVNNFVVHNCKSFSTSGTGSDDWGKEKLYSENVYQRTDDLFYEEMRKIKAFMPKVFVCENVKGMVEGDAKGYFVEIMRDLKALGYEVKAQVLNAARLDVPQARERVIFVGVRNDLVKRGFHPVFPRAKPYMVNVNDVLPHIAYLKSKVRGDITYVPASVPSPTIVASDGTNSETAGFSSGGFIETMDGERRKYTIEELKKIFTFPEDFVLTGTYKQQFERIGRSVPPLMMYRVCKTICTEILDKL